jgi:hypothetical protein
MLTVSAVRSALETAVMGAALERHFEQYPGARPSLAQVGIALAALADLTPVAWPDLRPGRIRVP